MDTLAITVGEGVNQQDTQGTKLVTWESLARRLAKFRVDSMTVDRYHALTQEGQAKVKDGEYMIGGPFKEGRRRREDFIGRTLVSLDADHFGRVSLFDVDMAFAEWANVIHSTHSFTEERPKVRIILPLDRMITDPREYQAVARWLASQLDIEVIDHTCFRVTQLMFLPSRCVDGREYYRSNKGPPVCVDGILAHYYGYDALDSLNWARSERESRVLVGVEKAGNPYEKPGLVGWFNSHFGVHAVLADQRFSVSSEFEQIGHDRYLPMGSTGGPGAVVYPSEPQLDDDAYLYVNHQTPPYGNKNLCAYDLVRIGEFGDWTDEEVAKELPLAERESQRLMNDLVRQLPEFQANPMDELEELPDEDIEDAKNQFASDAVNAMKTMPDDMTKGAGANLEEPNRLTVALTRTIIDTAKTENHLRKATNMIGASGFSLGDKSILAKMLNDKYKSLDLIAPGIAEIKSDIRRIAKGAVSRDDAGDPEIDIEDELITQVLANWFDGGETLMRIEGVFWRYLGGVWRMAHPDLIHQVLDNEIIRIRKEQPELAHALMAVLNDTKTSTLSNALWGLLQRRVTVSSDDDPLGLLQLDKPSIANCLNGEIHFDTDGLYDLIPHDPTHYLTHQIKCAFDPQAKCPLFDAALERIFRDQDDVEGVIRHFEEICGYLVQLRRDRKIWLLWHGSGDNGKSTLASILLALLGEAGHPVENIVAVQDDKHWSAGVTNALVLIEDDYPAGQLLPDAAVKKFSESKELTANPKFGGQFRFICRAPVMILSNSWPETRDVSDALVSRANVFDFNTKIEAHERDIKLREHIVAEELPGVLNRFLEGYARVVERGDWDLPLDCERARSIWAKSANVVNLWMDECVELTGDPRDITEQGELWRRFEVWMLMEGSRTTMQRRGFYQRLDSMGFSRRGMGKRRQGYVGVKLRVDDEPL